MKRITQDRLVYSFLSVLTILLVIAGCATQIDLDTNEKKIGAVYSGIIAASKSTQDSLEAGRIDQDQALVLLTIIKEIDSYADLATDALAAGDTEGVSGYLALATAAAAKLEQKLLEASL